MGNFLFLFLHLNYILFCQVGTRILCAARTSYRLLLVDSEIFSKLRNWNWSCFLDLVKQTSNPDLSSSAADNTVIADIKWCGIQILSVILKMSHIPTPHFSIGATEAFSCFLRLVMSNSLSKLLILKLKFKQHLYIYLYSFCSCHFQLEGVLSRYITGEGWFVY